MYTISDILFWLAFGISVSPGIGTGFLGFLFFLVLGFLLACVFEWLSVLLLYSFPLKINPEKTRSDVRGWLAFIAFGFGVFLLIGVLICDRWIATLALAYLFST